jgi:hypothetical protein
MAVDIAEHGIRKKSAAMLIAQFIKEIERES